MLRKRSIASFVKFKLTQKIINIRNQVYYHSKSVCTYNKHYSDIRSDKLKLPSTSGWVVQYLLISHLFKLIS